MRKYSSLNCLCALCLYHNYLHWVCSDCHVQFSSVQSLSHVWLCNPMNCSTPGLLVHHQLLESNQTYVHWVSDAINLSHPLLSPSPPSLNLSQHQGLFKWVSSLHQVVKILELQLQHQSFQWTLRTDLVYDGQVRSPCSPKNTQSLLQHHNSKP